MHLALDDGELVEAVDDLGRLAVAPGFAADGGHVLVVVADALGLGDVLVRLAVQHEGVERTLDLAALFGLFAARVDGAMGEG